jgi:hypothetical protein
MLTYRVIPLVNHTELNANFTVVSIPEGAEFRGVKQYGQYVYLEVIAEETADLISHVVRFVRIGEEGPEKGTSEFVGTVVLNDVLLSEGESEDDDKYTIPTDEVDFYTCLDAFAVFIDKPAPPKTPKTREMNSWRFGQ